MDRKIGLMEGTSLSKNARKGSKALYKKLTGLKGIEDIGKIYDRSEDIDFTLIDVYTGLIFSVGPYNDFDYNLYVYNGNLNKLGVNVSIQVVQNLDENDIIKFVDDYLYEDGVLRALDSIGFKGVRTFNKGHSEREQVIKDAGFQPLDKNESLNQLKESLDSTKYNKIQALIKECLREGLEVEISIPKKKLLKERK